MIRNLVLQKIWKIISKTLAILQWFNLKPMEFYGSQRNGSPNTIIILFYHHENGNPFKYEIIITCLSDTKYETQVKWQKQGMNFLKNKCPATKNDGQKFPEEAVQNTFMVLRIFLPLSSANIHSSYANILGDSWFIITEIKQKSVCPTDFFKMNAVEQTVWLREALLKCQGS